MTFIGALRTDGLTAPMVLKGAINADIFYEYVKQILLPTLKCAFRSIRPVIPILSG